MTLPATHRKQPCCAKCKHVFLRGDYDWPDEFFCARDGVARPKCGSLGMGESFYTKPGGGQTSSNYAEKTRAAWKAWSEPRRVDGSDVCDEFEE